MFAVCSDYIFGVSITKVILSNFDLQAVIDLVRTA